MSRFDLVLYGFLFLGLAAPSFAENDRALGKAAADSKLYIAPYSKAYRQANLWRSSRPADASLMDLLAQQPVAQWFGSENEKMADEVRTLVGAAAANSSVPVLVAYNIPHRDCGGYSAGGARSDSDYLSWVSRFAGLIGGSKAIVILEPDALVETECLSETSLRNRMSLISKATIALKKSGQTTVYIDAGHSRWAGAGKIAARLQQAGIEHADGFALNVSNFETTDENITYGTQISSILGGKHFVIDTSRNGLGSNDQWCNPPGRAIGQTPTLSTGHQLVDAYLWIKVPGESDGTCHGGPKAGKWWADYALELVRNAHRRASAVH